MPTVLALVLWGLLTFSGAFGMAEIAEEGAPGYPNAAQVVTYVLIPLLMTGLCIFLTAAAGREARAMTVGCLGGVALLALLPWALVVSGGV